MLRNLIISLLQNKKLNYLVLTKTKTVQNFHSFQNINLRIVLLLLFPWFRLLEWKAEVSGDRKSGDLQSFGSRFNAKFGLSRLSSWCSMKILNKVFQRRKLYHQPLRFYVSYFQNIYINQIIHELFSNNVKFVEVDDNQQ